MATREAVLVDVRDQGEWSAGRIPGAKHIPLKRLQDQSGTLPQGKAVIAVCRSGHRSALAARMLSGAGYDAANLAGGVRAWVREGLPFEGRVA
ncbi:MAG: rhodanese-like domain-containing protein [Actinomycetota bacterium]|nr:rhodanese-like domain-containing protein [Actinomycetota bacterium]